MEKMNSPEEEGIVSAGNLQTLAIISTVPWVSSLLVHSADYGFSSLYNHTHQSLKNLSLSSFPPSLTKSLGDNIDNVTSQLHLRSRLFFK
jgi:hypothetical protein